MLKPVVMLSLSILMLATPQIVHSEYLGGKYEYRSGQWTGWSAGPIGFGLGGRQYTNMYKNDGDTYWIAQKYEKPSWSEIDRQIRRTYKVSCFWRQIETSSGWIKEDEMEPGEFFRWLLNHHCD